MTAATSHNVGDLLETLCHSLYRDFTNGTTNDVIAHSDGPDAKFIRRCKSLAYEVLLKKSPARASQQKQQHQQHQQHQQQPQTIANINTDPITELRFCQFEWKLQQGLWKSLQFGHYGLYNGNGRRNQEKLALMEKAFDHLDRNDDSGIGQMPIIFVLTNLINLSGERQNRRVDEENSVFHQKNSNVRRAMSRAHLTKFDLEIQHLPKVNDFLSKRPRFRSLHTPPTSQLSFQTSRSQPTINQRSESDFIRSLSLCLTPQQQQQQQPPVRCAAIKNQCIMFQMANTWERLGEQIRMPAKIPIDNKQYAGDCTKVLLRLDGEYTKSQHRLAASNVVAMPVLVSHIKSMLVGIDTDTFQFNVDLGIFSVNTDITVDGVRTTTTNAILREFIECGSCYKRLKMVVSRDKNDVDQYEHSYMFMVMCNAFDKYLETFRRNVIFVDDKSVLQLSQRLAPLISQIRNLAKVLSIHPDDRGQSIPIGSKFLGFLYKLTTSVLQKDVSRLLVYILTECCDIYFRNFEIWIYQGIINNACGDLFIGHINTYRPRTLYHFERAHFIRPESIPGFLEGFEELVLLCGKYTNLLKTYNPSHLLFDMKPPTMHICLSYNQIERLEVVCREYIQNAHELCGQVIDAKIIFQKSIQNVNQLTELSKQRLQEHTQRWQANQLAKKAVVRCEAEKEHEMLMQQIEEKRERILRERRAGIDLDRRNEAIQNRMESEAIERDNVERMRRITRLAHLEEIANNQLNRAEDKIRQLNGKLEERSDAIISETDVQIIMKSDTDEQIDRNQNELSAQMTANNIVIGVATDTPFDNLDAINQNTIDSTQTVAARRNRDHMIASSIVLGNTVAHGLTTERQLNRNIPFIDKNSNRIDNDGEAITATETAVILPTNQTANDSNVVLVQIAMQDVNSNFECVPSPNKEYSHSAQQAAQTNDGKLRASLSLELKPAVEDKLAQLTPMSTTSDHILDQSDTFDRSVNYTADSKISSDEFMSADGSPMQVDKSHDVTEYSPSMRSTAKRPIIQFPKAKVNHFLIKELTIPQTSMLNSMTSTPNHNNNKVINLPSAESAKYSIADVRDIHFSNLANFLQKSFSIPLHAHFSILNNEILKIFLCDLNIFSHFNSLRNYFLMMDSEFANQIFVGLMEKLETIKSPNELVNSCVLHSILGNALHSNVAAADKNSDNLSFAITNISNEWHRESNDVLNPILLSYQVEWPLNLVLGAETIEHYGYIFQYLLKIRRVAWVLEQLFFKLKDVRKQSANQILKSQQYIHVQHIRHKLFCFINALQSYINSVALQSSWLHFCDELQRVKSLEDLCRSHAKYLNRIGFLCMLTKKSQGFLAKLEDVFSLIIRFVSQLNMRNWRCDENFIYTHPKYSKILQIENDFHTLIRFIIHAGRKMSNKGFQKEIDELINLINMNGWYDEQNIHSTLPSKVTQQ